MRVQAHAQKGPVGFEGREVAVLPRLSWAQIAAILSVLRQLSVAAAACGPPCTQQGPTSRSIFVKEQIEKLFARRPPRPPPLCEGD